MNVSDVSEACAVESLDRRWYLVAVCGTALSVLSIVCNIIISKVLLASKHAHFYFLALLALSDCFLSLNYGPVIAMDIIKDRVKLIWLSNAYLIYVGPLLALCQISMTFSCYLIILATIERYLITLRAKCLGTFRKCRGMAAFFMLVLSVLLRGPILFEMQIEQNEMCIGELSEYYLNLSPIVNEFCDSSRQIGTEIDAVAIAIARRLLSNELVFKDSKHANDSFVISNHHASSGDDEDDDDDDKYEIPHMV
uniref:G-protein coupled receptors family 1 profile domain-containing protein n=1 Tax=Caenorhabditis japonica TaxID=281687 RepID=A0A8R1HMV4_CAEJA